MLLNDGLWAPSALFWYVSTFSGHLLNNIFFVHKKNLNNLKTWKQPLKLARAVWLSRNTLNTKPTNPKSCVHLLQAWWHQGGREQVLSWQSSPRGTPNRCGSWRSLSSRPSKRIIDFQFFLTPGFKIPPQKSVLHCESDKQREESYPPFPYCHISLKMFNE